MRAKGYYQALLRLAWLLLDVPDADGEHRLARAHRLARRAQRWRPLRRPSYPAARRRIVRHVLTKEQRPQPDRLQRRLRVEPLPLGGDAGRLQAEIKQLSPYSRAAYLLERMEGLSRDEVRAEFGGGGEKLAAELDTVRDQVEAATGLGRKRQRELLVGADFDPSWVSLSPRTRPTEVLPRPTRRRGRLGYVGYAGIVLLAVAVGIVPFLPGTPGRTEQQQPWNEVVTVAANKWRDVDAPNYGVWPTSGELRADQELIREAARTWYERAADAAVKLVGGPPPAWWANPDDAVQLLFAGRIDGRTTVLMRQDGQLARYERQSTPGADAGTSGERLVISPVEAAPAGQDAATSGVLLPLGTDKGIRFLVPPWLTDLQVSPLGKDRPAWRPVKVDRHGVTQPLSASGPAECLDGFLIKGTVTSPDGRTSTEVLLYRPGASQTAQVSVTRPSERRVVTSESVRSSAAGIDEPWVRRVLRSVVCDEELIAKNFSPTWVGLDIVGHGNLPRGQGPASLLNLYVEYVGDDPFNTSRQLTARVLTGPHEEGKAAPGVSVIESSQASDSEQNVAGRVITTWWQAPSGRWYYLVAGYPDVRRIKLVGGIKRTVGSDFTATRGPKSGKRENLPVVRVRAFDKPRRSSSGSPAT